ncbi:cathelin-related peptide SC5-like, partial [Pseudonaja textilis]|uniref:cathelin-related peptide SC5-like n=1 Tax=Pseudonaja textilis TaxID=8673 RepID=UPI000EA91A71
APAKRPRRPCGLGGSSGVSFCVLFCPPLCFLQDPNSKSPQGLKFSIKETVCPSSPQSRNLTQCDFKEDGLDQDCSGIYSAQQEPPILVVQCEDIDQELNRITRSRWRKVARKVGRFVRRYGPVIASVVG